jgi:hypothetical protein
MGCKTAPPGRWQLERHHNGHKTQRKLKGRAPGGIRTDYVALEEIGLEGERLATLHQGVERSGDMGAAMMMQNVCDRNNTGVSLRG